jgi:hypothetical protein
VAGLPGGEKVAVIACEVMRGEIEKVAEGRPVRLSFLDQGLHRTPQKMAALIQEKIDLISERAGRVVVGYGLCSGGIKGIRCRRRELVLPRCHDCIALFLGSTEAYQAAFASRPGTYYLTPGWVAAKKDPLGIIYDDYAPRHGIETAFWAMEEELKHYTHIALINTGVGDTEALRRRTKENCAVLGKEYCEIAGSLAYFERLIGGPYAGGDFVVVPNGGEVTEDLFL